MNCVFLLNKVYMPYYKWSFRALRKLPLLSELAESLEYLISNGNSENEIRLKSATVEKICTEVIAEIKNSNLSDYSGDTAEGHAYAVNNSITDHEIRNLHILCAV